MPIKPKPLNLAPITTFLQDWPAIIRAAKDATTTYIRNWQDGVAVRNGIVNGPVLELPKNCLIYSEGQLDAAIRNAVRSAGAATEIYSGWSAVPFQAWVHWLRDFTIIAPVAYPAFAAFPGPYGPPIQNAPFPMSLGKNNITKFSESSLKNAIKGWMHTTYSQPGAPEAVAEYAKWLSTNFTKWLGLLVMIKITGEGPVPTFALPSAPVGPVVNGTAKADPGFLSGSPKFASW